MLTGNTGFHNIVAIPNLSMTVSLPEIIVLCHKSFAQFRIAIEIPLPESLYAHNIGQGSKGR